AEWCLGGNVLLPRTVSGSGQERSCKRQASQCDREPMPLTGSGIVGSLILRAHSLQWNTCSRWEETPAVTVTADGLCCLRAHELQSARCARAACDVQPSAPSLFAHAHK